MHSNNAAMALLQPDIDHSRDNRDGRDSTTASFVHDHVPIHSPLLFSSSSSTLPIQSPTLELDSPDPLSPRTLYAQSFDRPQSARSLPTGRFRKVKQMTGSFVTTEEEFEALPIAVRRKYFSTLERLRFAQNSRSNAINELPIQTHRKSALADRRGVSVPLIVPGRKPSSSHRLRKLARQQSVSSDEASWFLTLPEKIKKKQFSREEQVILAARLRDSVILDAADEAIYKASRRASRIVEPACDPLTPSTLRSIFDGRGEEIEIEDSSMAKMESTIYESFRWMDEEEDLDLKLALDDYHANLDGVVLPSPNSNRRPSFRRQMSISKTPFGRTSLSSIQPRSPRFEPPSNHNRQRSRAMSLIAPRHAPHDSIISIDPNATHYQDPEARLKLRVYLASAQKFDEVIEFGFPSMDPLGEGDDKENRPPKRSSKYFGRTNKNLSAELGQSFLEDDTGSLFEDDISMADPESPLTPMGLDIGLRGHSRQMSKPTTSKSGKTSSDWTRLSAAKPAMLKQCDGYTQALAGSREMTLRMTLTRPDLRADEGVLYGWQASKSPLREAVGSRDDDEKYAVKGPLGGADGWGNEKDNGVVKRFWKRVKSSQKKGL